MLAVFCVHIGLFMNLCVNTVFASVPIIHKYTRLQKKLLSCKQFLRIMRDSKMPQQQQYVILQMHW
jgi:hypothetical protein